ncbi:MAG: helix-turn-helix domain-containing protein [Clostridiales bacterium]|nr:helix-turn-helix domain-containing protein [Clostridiales bacterium]
MDAKKIGSLICELRTEKKFTQKELASMLNVSDKAVSKWERGGGYPDLSMFPKLSQIFNVDMEKLVSGEISGNDSVGGNMKNIDVYVCEECGNTIMSTGETSVTCCSKKLSPLKRIKAEDKDKLNVELIENEYFVSGSHEMTKEHYITFVALVTGDTILMKKQYPEWDLQVRLPRIAHGTLIWHCSNHGLFYQFM